MKTIFYMKLKRFRWFGMISFLGYEDKHGRTYLLVQVVFLFGIKC